MHYRQLKNILFIDIETVPQEESYDALGEEARKLWDRKAQTLLPRLTDKYTGERDLYERAGIYAEFGRIICISAGYVTNENGAWEARIKSFSGHDEKALLEEFTHILKEEFGFKSLCAHNGKEFDFPYLCRRLMINRLPIPRILNLAGLKPWEVPHYDTMEMWKFGDYKSFVSLDLLAHVFGIPTPKEDIDGSMVREVYYVQNDLERIAGYCSKDVYTLMRIFFRMQNIAWDEEQNPVSYV
ncbi:MAG: 3'-5' exonuclease [Bacteroidia bacterium]|nr:3'-5' exonuclease [Bacteroidia bacterium]